MAHVLLTCLPRDRDRGLAAFVATQAQQASMITRVDARELAAPPRFWPPTKALIANAARTEAWLLLLTDDVLADPVAIAVLKYCLGGARTTREADFPIVALRPGSSTLALPDDLFGLSAVSLSDSNWPETVRAKIERRQPRRGTGVTAGPTIAYAVCLHARATGGQPADGGRSLALEFRPGQASWDPFFVGLPVGESAAVNPMMLPNIRGACPTDGETHPLGWSMEGPWQIAMGTEPATRRTSYYLLCDRLPSVVRFGVPDGHLQYTVRLRPVVD